MADSTIKQNVDSDSEWKKWKVAKIPQAKAGTAATGTGGWTVGVFDTDKKKKSAAIDYAGTFAKKKNMGEFCKAGGYLPTRKSVFEDVKFFSEDPYMQTYKELLKDGRASNGCPNLSHDLFRVASSRGKGHYWADVSRKGC